jgi:hypothetical protein
VTSAKGDNARGSFVQIGRNVFSAWLGAETTTFFLRGRSLDSNAQVEIKFTPGNCTVEDGGDAEMELGRSRQRIHNFLRVLKLNKSMPSILTFGEGAGNAKLAYLTLHDRRV